jgi:Dolichyl-phosphate-mannose-protein mannosyltransferase
MSITSTGALLGFPRNYLTNDEFLYGTAFQYAVGALLLPLKLVATLLPAVSSRYILLVAIACRLASVAMGTLAVYLGFRVGRRLFGETAGILTAAFMSVSLYLTLNSAFATVDVTIACLVLLNLLLCLRAAEEPSVRAVMVAGFGAGLLFATKISTLTFIIIPAALGAVTPPLRRARLALAYLAVAAAVFAISTPQVPLHLGEYLQFMRAQKAEWLDRNPDDSATHVGGMVDSSFPSHRRADLGAGDNWDRCAVVWAPGHRSSPARLCGGLPCVFPRFSPTPLLGTGCADRLPFRGCRRGMAPFAALPRGPDGELRNGGFCVGPFVGTNAGRDLHAIYRSPYSGGPGN